ncbi:hypothetical protein BVZ79_01325B, partial [Haemophilus influenzae]
EAANHLIMECLTCVRPLRLSLNPLLIFKLINIESYLKKNLKLQKILLKKREIY